MKRTDEHPTCHCGHFIVVETKISFVEKALAIVAVGLVGLGATLAGQFISHRISWEAPPSSASERLFMDRVSQPEAPTRSK